MIATGKLTVKQKRFIEEYLTDLNATQAAVRAGYSKRTARQQGALNMANAAIGAAIAEAMEKRSERTEIKADAVLARFWDIATADPNEIVSVRVGKCERCYSAGSIEREPRDDCEVCGGEGVPVLVIADTKSLKGAARKLYAGAKQTKFGVEVQLHDQMKALENVARHLGMFNDKITLKGDAENPLMVLIQRINSHGSSIRPVIEGVVEDYDLAA
jgi:phage terminase small subunit